MADLKLFRINSGSATELRSTSVALERSLQQLIERNMEEMFATRFLASEFSTGPRHGGRIDSLLKEIEYQGSLGIDQVILSFGNVTDPAVIERAAKEIVAPAREIATAGR